MKVEFVDRDYNLVENGQNASSSFMVGHMQGNKYVQTSPWFVCRDYFSDLAYYYHTGIEYGAYGFHPQDYRWDASGFVAYLGAPREEILKQLASLNKMLKAKKCPTIELQAVQGRGDTSPYTNVSGECGFETSTEHCENLYWVPVDSFWGQSCFHLYMLSAFIRSLYWAQRVGIDYWDNKLISQISDNAAETAHLVFFEDNVWPIVKDIILEPVDNVLCTDDPNYDYALEGACYLDDDEDYIHNISGTTSPSYVVVHHGLIDWNSCSLISAPRINREYEGPNNILCRKLNAAIWKFKEKQNAA